MTEAQQLQYHLTNLLLADKLAIAYGRSRHAAIVRWARRLQEICDDKKMLSLTGKILSNTPHKVVAMIRNLENDMIQEGLYKDELIQP